MATAARVLLDERLRDLEDSRDLSRAEEWQRSQAWSVWEAIEAGDRRDVPMDDFREATEQALGRLAARIAAPVAAREVVASRPTKTARPRTASSDRSRKR